jgi:hypothetical protein
MLSGCNYGRSKEWGEDISNGIVIEVLLSDSETSLKSVNVKDIETLRWIQLDQLKTHNMGFRSEFGKYFNLTNVTQDEDAGKINGKSGCLYAGENCENNGNATLYSAFTNKVFNEKYWVDPSVVKGVADLSITEYGVNEAVDEAERVASSLIAYYDLCPMSGDEDYVADSVMTREQFFTLVTRADTGVTELTNTEAFNDKCCISNTNMYVGQSYTDGYLSLDSLNRDTLEDDVSKLEVIYTIINRYFAQELATERKGDIDGVKDGGNLAFKRGFQYKDSETKEMVNQPLWELYTLNAMMAENKIDEAVYQTFLLANELGIVTEFGDYNSSVTYSAAMTMLTKAYQAHNTLYGYATEVEYGTLKETHVSQLPTNSNTVYADATTPILNEDTGVVETGVEPELSLAEVSSQLIGFKEVLENCKEELYADGATDADIEKEIDSFCISAGYTREELEAYVAPVVTTAPKPQVVNNTPQAAPADDDLAPDADGDGVPDFLEGCQAGDGQPGGSYVVPSGITGNHFTGQ